MGQGLQLGEAMPDIELPDHNGVRRTLTELASGDPLVVLFYRGWWCPKEQAFFRRLAGWQSEVEVAYTRIVAISVDPPGEPAAFRAGLDARWTFLSDAGREYLHRLDLLETTDTVGLDLAGRRPHSPEGSPTVTDSVASLEALIPARTSVHGLAEHGVLSAGPRRLHGGLRPGRS